MEDKKEVCIMTTIYQGDIKEKTADTIKRLEAFYASNLNEYIKEDNELKKEYFTEAFRLLIKFLRESTGNWANVITRSKSMKIETDDCILEVYVTLCGVKTADLRTFAYNCEKLARNPYDDSRITNKEKYKRLVNKINEIYSNNENSTELKEIMNYIEKLEKKKVY